MIMAKVQSPQLGYNTNVRHKGKLFHIQTEDSGVARPHIITHLFVDGGRILKSVKSSYADSLEEADLIAYIRRRMQEQHKAMFVALRDGEFDALLEPAEVPPIAEPIEPRITAPPPPPVEAPTMRSLAPPPRSTLSPAAGTPTPAARVTSSRSTGSLRATGARTADVAVAAREVPAVPGSLLPPRLPAVERPPSNPPVFSNSMRYTAPRVAPPSLVPPPRERAGVTERVVRESSLNELILAMLAEEVPG
jgi:hypothetical protein